LHNFYEIEFVIAGNGVEVINGNRIPASKGDIFIITPETYHSIEDASGFDIVSIAIASNFTNIELLSQIAIGNEDTVFHSRLSKKDFNFVLSLCNHIEDSIKNENPYDSEIAKNCVNLIIAFILEHVEKGTRLRPNITAVKKAMIFIRKNYADSPTLSQVAEHVNISKNYFSVLFKENSGISFKQFLNDVKLSNAARMLKQTELPIVDICHDCGYDSLSTFYRKFKEKFSVSPQTYRNQNSRELK